MIYWTHKFSINIYIDQKSHENVIFDDGDEKLVFFHQFIFVPDMMTIDGQLCMLLLSLPNQLLMMR
jgi:hypothetical protein